MGFRSGAGAALSDAGTGATVGVSVAAGAGECARSPALRHWTVTGALPIQMSGPGKLTVPVAGTM